MLLPFFRKNFVKSTFLLLYCTMHNMFSRNFWNQSFPFFHTVINRRYHTLFWQKFRESNVFIKEIINYWFNESDFYFFALMCTCSTIFYHEMKLMLCWNELIFREINRKLIIEKYFVKSTVRLCRKWLDFTEVFEIN